MYTRCIGADPQVLAGAWESLSSGMVKILQFEYNAQWSTASRLQRIVAQLDDFGYSCYFGGRHALVKLSPSCFTEKLEFRAWSNVICASREQVPLLVGLFDRSAVAFAPQ